MDWLNKYKNDIEEALRAYVSGKTGDGEKEIYEAAAYSLLNGGKRLRGVLLLEFCRACGGDVKKALPFACGMEMIHAYSLVHDDLPCMDDDDLRRGLPTSHKKFGEGIAVLAGDGLLNLAFEAMLSAQGLDPALQLQATRVMAKASGMCGMIAGQVIDIQAEFRVIPLSLLETLQELKTGALLQAACEVGALLAGADEVAVCNAKRFGLLLGKAFQIQDDILDIEGDVETLGKATGSDAKQQKSTFVTLIGLEECKRLASALTDEGIAAIQSIENNDRIIALSKALLHRKI